LNSRKLLFSLCAALLPSVALADPATGFWFGGSAGYRHSFSEEAGGFSLGAHLGVSTGRLGFEYSSQWFNDHTFKPPEERNAGHNTNWLDVLVAPVHGEHFRLWIGGGGGLGWVRPPGKPKDLGADGVPLGASREMAVGAHEYLRFDLAGGEDTPVFYALRFGGQHTWQDTALLPKVNHAIDLTLIIGFGR